MANVDRIMITSDLDGVHFKAPLPFITTVGLLRGKFELPSPGYVPSKTEIGSIVRSLSFLFHQVRPFKDGDTLREIISFKEIAQSNQREVRLAVLSGRQPYLHDMTIRKLNEHGFFDHFDDVFWNDGGSSSGWKEFETRRLVEEGNSVIHIEDDLRAALRVARVSDEFEGEDRVLVYLLKNFSNNSRLLRRAGIQLPANVVKVNTISEAATDFALRLKDGRI